MIRLGSVKEKLLSRIFSRHSWFAGLLDLPGYPVKRGDAGVILIQVDGLSLNQLQKALAAERMPFLSGLLSADSHVLTPCYSGIPSTTPAFQGELFFGVKSCVPAFEFYDREDGEHKAMFHPTDAAEVSARLEKKSEGLLAGGTAYSNIFAGGADEARYCADRVTLESLLTAVNPFKMLFILMFHIGKLIRIAAYSMLESVLAVTDFFRSIITSRHIRKELTFILARIFACIGLRELIRFRVKMDIARGVPVISANLIGYDEQAHRRGPGSRFAHWTLRGIDDVIRDIYETAVKAEGCGYRFIVYSDHGQEEVVSYADRFGKSVRHTVQEVYAENKAALSGKKMKNPDKSSDYLYYRSRKFVFPGIGFIRKKEGIPVHVEVTTMGPFGHVYLFGDMSEEKRSVFARNLVEKAGIPLVLYKHEQGIAAVNTTGVWDLEKERAHVLKEGHPFADQVVRDLASVLDHPDAGELVISGWSTKNFPLTFSIENGAHGGIGSEETRGFVLLPREWESDAPFLRALDIRELVMAYMKTEKQKRNY
ncbi:MAG: hypothetical protein R6V41_08125 [Desulfobacteraceae bacterium]